jgi:hypothetical protein
LSSFALWVTALRIEIFRYNVFGVGTEFSQAGGKFFNHLVRPADVEALIKGFCMCFEVFFIDSGVFMLC